MQNDPNEARSYFERALKIDPDFAPALYNLGLMTADRALIAQAQISDPWRVNAYQKFAPDKPWIAIFTVRELNKALYWSQGGFPVRGFTEIPLSFRKAISVYEIPLSFRKAISVYIEKITNKLSGILS